MASNKSALAAIRDTESWSDAASETMAGVVAGEVVGLSSTERALQRLPRPQRSVICHVPGTCCYPPPTPPLAPPTQPVTRRPRSEARPEPNSPRARRR